jgi:hypothetical protein
MPSAGLFASMLRTAAEINELSDAEFAAGQPFDIEGTVIFVATTASPGKIPNINIYDKTGHTCILADENTAVPQTHSPFCCISAHFSSVGSFLHIVS